MPLSFKELTGEMGRMAEQAAETVDFSKPGPAASA
jgi:hypothetical protein